MKSQASTLLHRAEDLIARGERLQRTKYTTTDKFSRSFTWVDNSEFNTWMASSLAFLRRVFGDAHTHTKLFEERCSQNVPNHAIQGTAILRAAHEEIQQGYLSSLEQLVSADVFSDFLDMADHLLANGYKDPAASLTGAVLEDGLRKIAISNGVTVKDKEDLSSLNQKLAQAGVYNRIVQKQVHLWSDVRNHADHGKFDAYGTAEVVSMHRGVSSFLTEYLTVQRTAG
jgi:hypothetical protein